MSVWTEIAFIEKGWKRQRKKKKKNNKNKMKRTAFWTCLCGRHHHMLNVQSLFTKFHFFFYFILWVKEIHIKSGTSASVLCALHVWKCTMFEIHNKDKWICFIWFSYDVIAHRFSLFCLSSCILWPDKCLLLSFPLSVCEFLCSILSAKGMERIKI